MNNRKRDIKNIRDELAKGRVVRATVIADEVMLGRSDRARAGLRNPLARSFMARRMALMGRLHTNTV